MRVALRLRGVATTLLLATPILRVRADLVIGTVVDVNMMQTERQDFEEGWGQWSETNMQLVDTSNVTDGTVIFTKNSKNDGKIFGVNFCSKDSVLTNFVKGATTEHSCKDGPDSPCAS